MAIRFGRGLTIEGRSAEKVIAESRARVKAKIAAAVEKADAGTPIDEVAAQIVDEIKPEIEQIEAVIPEPARGNFTSAPPPPPQNSYTAPAPAPAPQQSNTAPEPEKEERSSGITNIFGTPPQDEVEKDEPKHVDDRPSEAQFIADGGDPQAAQQIYDGLTFDWAPGVPIEEVIADPAAFDPVERDPYTAAMEDIGTYPITPDQYYGDEDALDFAGNPAAGGGDNTGSIADPTPDPIKELTPYAQGGTWYAVTGYPGLPVAYFVEYTLPGGTKIFYYADRKDLDGLEGIGAGQEPPIIATVSYNEFKQGRISGGSISDVVGTNQHYSTRVERTLMSPTGDLLLPDWASNDLEIKDMFYIAIAENWTDAKFLKQMAKTNAFQERYPAFNDMLSLTGGAYDRALANYQEYEENIRVLNNRYGETANVQDLAAEAIKKGFTVDDLKETYDIFERAEKNASTLTSFQNVIEAAGLAFDVTSPQGIVDFFKGTAPTEIYDIYEASSISEQAAKLDLSDLSVEEALEIAKNTPGQLTDQQVSASLQSAAQMITRYREYVDLGKYGLDPDTIINLSLGYREPGGLTEMELSGIVSRIIKEDENLQNLASGIAGSKAFAQKARQIRSF